MSPVRLLTNTPVPYPSVVLLSAIVGLGVVLQQTPLAATVAPPSDVTFPPLSAVVWVMFVTVVVVKVGKVANVENVT